MPTPEAQLARIQVQLDELLESVNSGPHVPWEKSIRGRLHRIDQAMANERMLAQAARELRRAQQHRMSRTGRIALGIAAIAAAAAPYVLFFLHG